MKSNSNLERKHERAMALPMVFYMMIFIMLLVVGFLLSVTRDSNAVEFYADQVEVTQVANNATEIVKSQILRATKDPELTWISQPGLLRTFDRSGQIAAFKLYSSDKLVEGSDFDPEAEVASEIPENWAEKTEEFVDLNKPVYLRDRWVYPIVDADGVDLVEGFSVSNPPTENTVNQLPMPVSWIYQFEDGSFGTVDDIESKNVVARFAFWTDDECSKVNINTASEGKSFDPPKVYSQDEKRRAATQPVRNEFNRFGGHPASTSLSAVFPGTGVEGASLYNLMANISPRFSSSNDGKPIWEINAENWAGSQGGTREAWRDFSRMIRVDDDRLYGSIDEFRFDVERLRQAQEKYNYGEQGVFSDGSISRRRFFLTANSSAPELNLYNEPRIALWPFNPSEAPGSSYPRWSSKDKLIAFCSTLGKGVDKSPFYFQRVNAHHPKEDYKNIQRNKELFQYLVELTERQIPGQNNTFAGKYGANRIAILTMMFDYIRSNINVANTGEIDKSPEEWSKMSTEQRNQARLEKQYSFPARHLDAPGNNNIGAGLGAVVPISITEGGVTAKGIGRFPTFSTINLQFVATDQFSVVEGGQVSLTDIDDLIQRWRDFLAAPVGNPPPSLIRRQVRLLVVPNMFNPVEAISPGVMPRFQYRITELTPLTVDDGDFLNIATGQDIGPEDLNANGSVVDKLGNPLAPLAVPFLGKENRSYAAPKNTWDGHIGLGVSGYDDLLRRTSSGDERSSEGKEFGGDISQLKFPFVTEPFYLQYRIAYQENGEWKLRYPDLGQTDAEVREAENPPKFRLNESKLKIEIFAGMKYSSSGRVSSEAESQSYGLNSDTHIQTFEVEIPKAQLPIPLLGTDEYHHKTKAIKKDGSGTAQAHTFYEMRDFQSRFDYINHASTVLRAGQVAGKYGGAGDPEDEASWEEFEYKGNQRREFPHEWPMDVVRTVTIGGESGFRGDLLYLAARPGDNPGSLWEPVKYYDRELQYIAAGYRELLGGTWSNDLGWDNKDRYQIIAGLSDGAVLPASITCSGIRRKSAKGGETELGIGDFQNAIPTKGYGSFVPFPDTGLAPEHNSEERFPYFNSARIHNNNWNPDTTENHFGLTFSPTRQIPSAVKFGWIPSRALDSSSDPSPWETLLFCPNPSGGRDTHRGWADSPPDHYFLDYFWMPVVDPYAISEGFQTSGKINLNYQIAPFTYIKRSTGLHAVMKNVEIVALNGDETTVAATTQEMEVGSVRHEIDVNETIKAFEERFDENKPFVTASQLTEMFLYPKGVSQVTNDNSIEEWWATKKMTGDNTRETPYNHIYPRICVKSNAYKIHVWAQTLQKKRSGGFRVVAEYRGEQILERYLDPNMDAPKKVSPLSNHYRFRTLNSKHFAP